MVAEKIKQLRADRGINQTQLASAMGVTQGTVGKWETGYRTPETVTIRKLAEYFNVTADYFLGGDSEVAMFTRKLANVPDEDRAFLMSNLNNTLEVYFKSKGLST